MTNAERQEKYIMAQMCKTGDWGVNKNTGEIKGCDEICRGNCLFLHGANNCEQYKADWLNAEYQEPPKEFSEADKTVMRVLDKIEWVVRFSDGKVYGYLEKPQKGYVCWVYKSVVPVCISNFCTSAKFLPISWDDDEPTSRKEILGEEK